jgi:NAD(P)H-hydrate epimerase
MLSAVSNAKKFNIVIVLKGHRTLITFKGNSFINTNGNAGLAKAGSGDALTGIISAFLAQGYSSLNAALLGVYIHGLAADITLKNQSMESMLITDVIDNLGKAFNSLRK